MNQGEGARREGLLSLVVALGSIVGAVLASPHPTGTEYLDPLYAALAGAIVPLATRKSSRLTWLWSAAWAVALCRDAAVFAGVAALGVAFAACFRSRRAQLEGALVGALAVQAMLRWPGGPFEGSTALAAVIALTPALADSLRGLAASARRIVLMATGAISCAFVILVVPAAVAVALSRGHLTHGVAQAEAAFGALRNGDVPTGSAELSAAAADFQVAARRTGAWWTAGADLVPVVAQQRRAVVGASRAAGHLAQVATTEARQVDFSRLRYRDGRIDLAAVAELKTPLRSVSKELASTLGALRAVRSGWLLPPLSSRLNRLTAQVQKAQSSSVLAGQAVADVPSLLGADGPRRYFLGLLDTSESRGLGGLLVWYGELDADQGHLSLGQFGDAVALGQTLAATGRAAISGPPDYVGRYGEFHPEKTLIDTPYSPDLPTVASVVAQLYGELGRPRPDGMIVVDPVSLAAVLALTGPVQVPPAGKLDSANLARFLEIDEYAEYPNPEDQAARRALLSKVMSTVSNRLLAGSLPGPRVLAGQLSPLARTGDLGVWSFHAADQGFLERSGLSDSFPSVAGGDVLEVTTQNAANNKIDAYLERRVDDDVTYSSGDGRTTATVTVNLRNRAPASGLSYQVIGTYPGVASPPVRLPSGTNLTWMTLYSPLNLTEATLDGRPLKFDRKPELGLWAYSAWVELPSNSERRVTFRLAGRLASGGYELSLRRQPMVVADRSTVSVRAGSKLRTWTLSGSGTDFRKFQY